MDNLPLLKDIHLPDPITRFPLGYGIILLTLVLILLICLFPYFKKLYLKSKKRFTLHLLKGINDANISNLCLISEILRRICKLKHQSAVSLYGTAWADFLNQKSTVKLPSKLMQLLVNAPYAPKNTTIPPSDFKAIQDFAVSFTENNL